MFSEIELSVRLLLFKKPTKLSSERTVLRTMNSYSFLLASYHLRKPRVTIRVPLLSTLGGSRIHFEDSRFNISLVTATYPIRRRFTRSTCYRRNVSKDATSRFGSNENIFPVCQSFETFHLVDGKCFQIKFITNKFFFTGRCHFQFSNIRITKRFWLAGDDDYLRGATSINHQVALPANFKMYSRSAKGGEKGDPNCNPWLAKMLEPIP